VDLEIPEMQMSSIVKHSTNDLDNSICPLCGGPNQCALAVDRNADECWCDKVEFPKELLAQIPDGAVRKTCVCQTCLINFQETLNSIKSS